MRTRVRALSSLVPVGLDFSTGGVAGLCVLFWGTTKARRMTSWPDTSSARVTVHTLDHLLVSLQHKQPLLLCLPMAIYAAPLGGCMADSVCPEWPAVFPWCSACSLPSVPCPWGPAAGLCSSCACQGDCAGRAGTTDLARLRRWQAVPLLQGSHCGKVVALTPSFAVSGTIWKI